MSRLLYVSTPEGAVLPSAAATNIVQLIAEMHSAAIGRVKDSGKEFGADAVDQLTATLNDVECRQVMAILFKEYRKL